MSKHPSGSFAVGDANRSRNTLGIRQERNRKEGAEAQLTETVPKRFGGLMPKTQLRLVPLCLLEGRVQNWARPHLKLGRRAISQAALDSYSEKASSGVTSDGGSYGRRDRLVLAPGGRFLY